MVYSPKWPQYQKVGQTEAIIQKLGCFPTWVAGASLLWTSAFFPGALAGGWIESGAIGREAAF